MYTIHTYTSLSLSLSLSLSIYIYIIWYHFFGCLFQLRSKPTLHFCLNIVSTLSSNDLSQMAMALV